MFTTSPRDLDARFREYFDALADGVVLCSRESHDPLFGCQFFPVCTFMDPSEAVARDPGGRESAHTKRTGVWPRSMAADVVLLRHGKPIPENDPAYRRLGELVRENMLAWGGDWDPPEVTHVELPA